MSDTSLPAIIRFDTTANRGAFTPSPGVAEQLYIWLDSDDEPNAYYWDGAAWQSFNAAVVADGDYGDITVSVGGTTWTVDNAAITDAKISNRAAVSVFGRSANSSGVGADIAAAANDRLLARTADTVAFQQLTVGMVPADTITGAKLTATQRAHAVAIVVDGGGSAITTGIKADFRFPMACTLTGWTILADQSGAIKFDVWKDTLANYPPDNADSITNAHEPEIPASGTNAEDTNIADWTTVAVSAGDCVRINVDSCTSITRATLILNFDVTG